MGLYIVDIHGELEGDYEIIRKYEEPTAKNNLGVDCISREQAIEALKEDAEKYVGFMEMESYIPEDAIGVIQSLPSVTPIRAKGHWREIDVNMYACSKCSHVLTINPLDNSISEMNTCPFCSADMREVVEE